MATVAKKLHDSYRLALGAYLLSATAFFVASFFPAARLWGLNWFGVFDQPLYLAFLVLAVALPLLLSRLQFQSDDRLETSSDTRRYFLYSVLTILVFLVGFYFLRARTHFLGDGYLLISRLTEGTHPIRPWNPGAYWIQDVVYGLLGASGKGSALAAFRLISFGSGFLFLIAAAITAARLYRMLAARLLFLLAVATGGYALVFFGHVENYPVLVLAVGLFGMLGLLAAQDKVSRYWILLPLAGALPLHPFSVVMIPAALYLLTQGAALGNWVGKRSLWLKLVVAMLLFGGAGFAFYHAYTTNYFFRFSIVPFMDNQFAIEGYTMFSGKHLLDYLNLLGLLMPGLLIGGLLVYRTRSQWKQPAYLFLLLLLAASLGVAFLFDPKLGMPRDWDMFSFVGIPLTLLALQAALDRRVRTAETMRAVGLVVGLGLIILIPRAMTQVQPETSIKLFDQYAELDLFKNSGGRFLLLQYLASEGKAAEANRRRTVNSSIASFEHDDRQAQSLMRDGNILGAMAIYNQVLADYPGYHNAWTNLGICHYQLRQYDSAVSCLRISNGLNPFSINVYHYLALSLYASGHDEEAEELWLEAKQLVPDDYRPYTYLLLMYNYSGRQEKYDALADRVLTLSEGLSAKVGFVGKSVEIHLMRGDLPAAERQGRRALQMGIGQTYICDLQERFPELKIVECSGE